MTAASMGKLVMTMVAPSDFERVDQLVALKGILLAAMKEYMLAVVMVVVWENR